MSLPLTIADRIDIPQHPTVVRLDDLHSNESAWISRSYFVTDDVKNHLHALKVALGRKTGTGMFLIGHYGSGKSHFLAYLIQQIKQHKWQPLKLESEHLSLINFSAKHSLESIVFKQLELPLTQDRREAFQQLQQQYPNGIILILDELSEFLRSKAEAAQFNEDIRFLQFLGEWAQSHAFWVIAAMQEQIEHTGDLDHSLYRKIKDRYPLRFLLTPVHVRDLVEQTLLLKKTGYDEDVIRLVADLGRGFPAETFDQQKFSQIYPLHPVTLDLLEEVRDSFSQARGVVEFVITQLGGHEERQIQPFLQRPWGDLLTPDYIVDHFKDLFEIQPEFVALSNQCLAWYRQHLLSLFPNARLQKLAKQLIKLLMLMYISPLRNGLHPRDAVYWLMFRASQLDMNKNVELLQNVLDTLVEQGRFVERKGNHYRLNLKQDTQGELEHHLKRAQHELQGKTQQVFDRLTALFDASPFNPFEVSLNEWQPRSYRWHFHERAYQVCLGEASESVNNKDDMLTLLVRLPWSSDTLQHEFAVLQPNMMQLTPQWVELAAMLVVQQQPLSNPTRALLARQIQQRAQLFHSEVRQAYQQSKLFYDRVKIDQNLMLDTSLPFITLVEQVIQRLLRKRYPSFERFAPAYGALAKHSWLMFLRQGLQQNLLSLESPDEVRLVQEAYLVPMGLLKRKGREYILAKRLHRHELVSVVLSMLQHEPEPGVIYQHLAEPVYGLVTDQVHCLLYFLLIQGEIDIVKDRHSLREKFETLSDPRQYDRVVVAHALNENETLALAKLLDNFGIKVPEQWTVSTQRIALDQLQGQAQQIKQQLQQLSLKLPDTESALKQQLSDMIGLWAVLDQRGDPFKGWQQFLYEIDSVQQFISELNSLRELPELINHLLTESGRYQHIQAQFQQHAELKIVVAEFSAPPGLQAVDKFKHWLLQTATAYTDYCERYTRQHDKWWAEQNFRQLLDWQIPAIGQSRHLGLLQDISEYQQLHNQIESKICRGIDKLDYQPFCHCGFDGKQAVIVEDIAVLDTLQRHIEQQIDRFFTQKKVRQRIAEWVEQGVEESPQTQQYLQGNNSRPDIKQLEVFDDYLSGVAITQVIDSGEFLQAFSDKSWEPEKLAIALQQWVQSFSQFASIRIQQENKVQDSTVTEAKLWDWIVRQALSYSIPLPQNLTAQQLKQIENTLRPEWVQPSLWQNMQSMGFSKACEIKLLKWLMNGTLDKLPAGDLSPCVEISRQIGQKIRVDNCHELANLTRLYYSKHDLFMQLNKAAWLKHLEQLAKHEIQPSLQTLPDFLNENPTEQWLVLDAMGLPLLDLILQNLDEWFPAWRISDVDFVLAADKTTTDEFYRILVGSEHNPKIVKINTIDDQIHQRFLPFDDLCRVIKTELTIAIKNTTGQLQPQLPLLISADHGFRIAGDGSRYQHGGSSTLERVIPLIFLQPV